MKTRHWDAIVIGTGMGGATFGYALARAGLRVLWCEKGSAHLGDSEALRGRFAEEWFSPGDAHAANRRVLLRNAGRCFDAIADVSGPKPFDFIPFIGAGGGGSTALYGMALERFFPADFSPRQHHPGARESTIPDHWPIGYADLEPYYTEAEKLYGVRGGGDALRGGSERVDQRDLPPLSPVARELFAFFEQKGLNPYRVPLACDRVPACTGCQGYLCARDCKIDSARACIQPALDLGAEVLDKCEVVRLEANADRITGVICRHEGRELHLQADLVALAAGALGTPGLLLASASPAWPRGLANTSGWVGLNLMRHYVDLYAVFPKHRPAVAGNPKELAWNDLYVTEAGKFGTFQSFGAMIPAKVLAAGMEQELRDKDRAGAAAALRLAKPLMASATGMLFARTEVFATIMEDLPYADNRVTLGDGGRLSIQYRVRDSEARRIAQFRERVRKTLEPYRFLQLRQAESNLRLAHACGTCRFGRDPLTSVLDPFNKAHGVANLYVVDASFFPSSGGTNPALTVAANALRVARHLNGIPQ